MLHCINVALVHITLLILHYLGVAPFTVLMYYINAALLYIALLILDYFNVVLVDVPLFTGALF